MKSASLLYASKLASREVTFHKIFEETPWLLPKHKIFISHSGRQKDFAEQLCEDLERAGYYPFFDKRSDSLPKGVRFPELIFKASSECLLAIVLLSEDFFTRTKWPMLELAEFVKAQKSGKDLRILPVLLGLSIEDLRSSAKWSKVWTKWRKQDRRLTHNVIKEWEAAVQALKPLNKISKSSYDGEVALRRGIVCSIMEMMPPDVRSDVLHVQGRERFCKELRSKFDTASTSRICENATVLGVFGIGGAGKSTLCMIITEFVRSEFFGRVCHIELSVETSTVDLHRKVLRQLFRVNEDYLNRHISTEGQGHNCLKELMPSERVFLALDNVSDKLASIDTANMFLRLRFHPNSMVLVTSRSDQVLCRSLGIPESNCLCCPSITSEEALCILLEQVNLLDQSLNAEQKKVLDQTVERSFFHGYHPMALKVLGAQLGTNPATWRESDLNLQWTSDVEHPLFSAIETNYARLPNQHIKDMFLDIALFAPEGLCTIQGISTWLTDTIYFENGIDDVEQKLGILRAKALLEIWRTDEEDVRIHDLYRMLAERMTSVEVSGNCVSRFIYQRGGLAAPKVLLNNDAAIIIERAAFVEAKFEMLGLETCSNLRVLSLRRCQNLRAVGIQRLGGLVSLELSLCPLESLDLCGLNSLRWLHVSSCENLIVLDASEAEHLGFLNVSKCSSLRELNLKNCLMIRLVSILYNDNLQHVNLGSGQQLTHLTLWFCEALTHVEVSEVVYVTTLKKRGCPRLLSLQGSDIMCKNLEYMRLQLWCKLTSPFIRALEISTALQVLDIWHCPLSRLPDLRRCLVLQELRLSNVDVLLDSNDKKLLAEYAGLLGISANDLELPKNLEDIRIESSRNVVVKEVFLKLQGLRHLRSLSLQDVRVGWDWELYRYTDGWRKSTYGRHDKMNFVSGELSSLALEGGFAGGEVEEVSKGWVHEDDEEVIALKRQIDEIHGQISAMGMKSRTASKAKRLQMSNISGNDDAEFYSLQHEESTGMKADDAGTSSDVNHLHSSRGAVQDEIEPSDYLGNTMRWIGVFYSCKKNLTQVEQMIKEEIELHWGWGTSAECSILQNTGLQQLFWNIMDKTMEFRGSPCWIVEQIIHATCRSCDTFCERLWQCQGTEVLQGNQKKCLLERCQKVHVEEIRSQLLFLTATNPMMQQVRWEIWERMIVKGVRFRRKTPTWGERLFCEGVVPVIPRLETVGKRLDMLSKCRGWKVQSVVESNKEGLEQVAWDWMWACHLCLSIEQLARQLGNNDVPYGLMQRHQKIQLLIRRVDAVFEIEVEKLLDSALASVEGCDCDEFDGLVRCCKIRQWLQELESCLSECGVMQGNKRTSFKESIPQINEMCQSITQIGKQLGLMEYFWPVMFEQLATMSGCVEGSTVKGRMEDLEGKAALLAVQLRQECPCMELLYVLLDAASKRKEGLKENIDIVCQKIDRFMAEMRVELTCLVAQFNFEDKMVIAWIKNILVVVAELRIKQLQYMKLAHCSLDRADNGRMEDMWERTKKLPFGLAEEWITIGGERQWIPSADLTEHLLCSNIDYTWEWTETLVAKLTEEMQFMELVLYPSQFSSLEKGEEIVDKKMEYPWERVDKLTLLLTNELIALKCMCTRLMYPKNVKDFQKRMNRMVERARRFGLARLVNLLTTRQQLIGEETLRRLHDLRGELELLRPSALATDADGENPILKGGRLSVLVVGGGQKPRGKKGIQRKSGVEFEPSGGVIRPFQEKKHDSYNSASTQQVYCPSLKEKTKVMVGKVRGLIVRVSSKKPSVKVDKGEEMKVDMDDDVGVEEDEEHPEMKEESAILQQAPFVKLWDDANMEQLLSLPLSQCTGLRHLCFSNCGLSNPRRQLVGQWIDRTKGRLCKDYGHITLRGIMSRIDWVAHEQQH